MQTYYKKIAPSYEHVYKREDATRDEELYLTACALSSLLKNKKVLEAACGTGHWTQILSRTAKQISGFDIVPELLTIAKQKNYLCPVDFAVKDAFDLTYPKHSFTGGLAAFWFSHIPKRQIPLFLEQFHGSLKKGATVFLTDHVYVPGLGGTLITKPDDENTYKHRVLSDGSEYDLLKNFYTKNELMSLFKTYDPTFTNQNIYFGTNFWYLYYKII